METFLTIVPYAMGLCGLAVLGFIGTIWGLMLLGIAGSVLKACWKVARRVWKWASNHLKSAPKAQAVSRPQGKPQSEPGDSRPLAGIQANWQEGSAKLACASKTLLTNTPPEMPHLACVPDLPRSG